MKITKYEHACWDVSDNGTRIVIDPGIFSTSFTNLEKIAVVVVTHNHQDHFNSKKLDEIIAANPDVQIFATNQVATDFGKNVTVPEIGKTYTVGGVTLDFCGEKHHLFDDVENIAVSINQKFFSPGDSYTKPSQPVTFAAVPASAPWLRIDEAIDNIKNIPARIVAPTHNALLSEIGESIHYRILGGAAKEANKEWRALKVGESLEI